MTKTFSQSLIKPSFLASYLPHFLLAKIQNPASYTVFFLSAVPVLIFPSVLGRRSCAAGKAMTRFYAAHLKNFACPTKLFFVFFRAQCGSGERSKGIAAVRLNPKAICRLSVGCMGAVRQCLCEFIFRERKGQARRCIIHSSTTIL